MLYYVGTCDAILIFPPLSSLILSYPLLHRLHSSSFQSSSLLISSILLISVSLMTCTSHPSNPPTNPPTQYLHFTLISSHFKCFHTAIEAPPPLPLHLPLSLSLFLFPCELVLSILHPFLFHSLVFIIILHILHSILLLFLFLLHRNAYHTLFVARISFDTTEKKLRREFEQYGPVRTVKMINDKSDKAR